MCGTIRRALKEKTKGNMTQILLGNDGISAAVWQRNSGSEDGSRIEAAEMKW